MDAPPPEVALAYVNRILGPEPTPEAPRANGRAFKKVRLFVFNL